MLSVTLPTSPVLCGQRITTPHSLRRSLEFSRGPESDTNTKQVDNSVEPGAPVLDVLNRYRRKKVLKVEHVPEH